MVNTFFITTMITPHHNDLFIKTHLTHHDVNAKSKPGEGGGDSWPQWQRLGRQPGLLGE